MNSSIVEINYCVFNKDSFQKFSRPNLLIAFYSCFLYEYQPNLVCGCPLPTQSKPGCFLHEVTIYCRVTRLPLSETAWQQSVSTINYAAKIAAIHKGQHSWHATAKSVSG